MPPHLPVEIHTSILKYLHTISLEPPPPKPQFRKGIPRYRYPDPPQPVLPKWLEHNLFSPSLFPFNAAYVCTMWRDILARIPECWTRLAFDVARDPTPVLDAFLWSKGQNRLQVVVFTSSPESEEIDNVKLNRRVRAVTRALEPHIPRCKSIGFQLNYSSSLPPPTLFFLREAPYLDEINLCCRSDDIDIHKDSQAASVPLSVDRPILAQSLNLETLSLTGFWFMHLALHVPKGWLKLLMPGQYPGLSISHFAFTREGDYSMTNFARYLSELPELTGIDLHDLSLAYEFSPEDSSTVEEQNIARSIGIYTSDFTFNAVSKDFILHFFTITFIVIRGEIPALTFERCEIPEITQALFADSLYLKNIIDDNEGSGLCRILRAWAGSSLTIDNCPSFNDEFLERINSDVRYVELEFPSYVTRRFFSDDSRAVSEVVIRWCPNQEFVRTSGPYWALPADRMTNLTIKDSSNFTVASLQRFIEARNDISNSRATSSNARTGKRECIRAVQLLLELGASGHVPVLTEEDKAWFMGNIAIFWRVENEDVLPPSSYELA